MSQISLKSISGITSITTPAGVDNRFSLYNFDSTERLVLDHSGNLNISGVSTATNFKTGSSNLHSTGLTVGDSFVHSTGINLGTGVTILNNGNATLDNVSISGVSTFGGNIVANGNIVGDTATTISGIAGVTAKPTAVDTDIFSIIRSDHASSKLFRIFQDSTSGGGAGGPHINTFNRNLMITASTSAATDSGLYLRTQGQLGIGTNNPTSKLDVVGDAKVSGVITATNFVGSGALLTGIVGGKFNGPAAGILTTSTVGIQTADVTSADLVGAATSMVGLYIGDGHLLFSNYLNKSGGYYITTGLNALNAGPVTLGSTMTLDGTWVIV